MIKSTSTYIVSQKQLALLREMEDVGDNISFEEIWEQTEVAFPFEHPGNVVLRILEYLATKGVVVPRGTRDAVAAPIAARCNAAICVSPTEASPCLTALNAFEPSLAEMSLFYAKSGEDELTDPYWVLGDAITFLKSVLGRAVQDQGWLFVVVRTAPVLGTHLGAVPRKYVVLAQQVAPPTVDPHIDEFLEQEFERIRTLPANAPDDNGYYNALYWALVVGLAKTKMLPVANAMRFVQYFLMTEHSDIALPPTIPADQDRLDQVQVDLRRYRIDPRYAIDYTNLSPEQFAKARRGMFLFFCIGAFTLVTNHYDAVNGQEFYVVGVLFSPILTTVCLAGLIDPRVFWAVSKWGRNMPVKFKIIGGLAGLTGVAISIYLSFLYQMW